MSTEFDPDSAISTIKRFITDSLSCSGLTGFVVGLSGGLDSSLATTLAVEAVGPRKVFGLLMPYRKSSVNSAKDAEQLARRLGIDHRVVDISPMIDAFYDRIDDSNRLRAGNKMARERMAILFDAAHQMQRLVLGTGNRSEICLGYTTLFGDSACSINPIGELYKTEVRLLAKKLDLPDMIINKTPSGDLWSDQTDEGEIGVTYDVIDRLLRRIVDEGVTSRSQLESEGFNAADIDRVISLFNQNSFKRRLPDIAMIGKPAIPDKIELDA